MLYPDFISTVRSHLEDSTQDTFTDASIGRWLAMGYGSFFESTRDYTDVVALVTTEGVSRYTLEPRSIEVVKVTLDGTDLSRVNFGSSSAGFAVTSTEIVISPAPLGGQELVYTRVAVPVVPNEAHEEVPDRWVEPMVNYCCAKAFEQIERFDNATWYMSRFNDAVLRAIDLRTHALNANIHYEPVDVL